MPIAGPSPWRRGRQPGYVLLPVALLLGVVAALAFMLAREGAVGARLVGAGTDAERVRYVAEAGLAHAQYVTGTSACTGYALPATPFGSHSYSATFSPTSGSPVSIAATGRLADGTTRTLTRSGVRVYETSTDMTVQPDAAAGKDTYVNAQAQNRNYGAGTTLGVDSGGAHDYYALLSFDLSVIPAGVEITGAELRLFLQSFGSTNATATFTAYRMLEPWTEGTGNGTQTGDGATYNTADGSTSWNWPGNHDDTAPLAARKVNPAFSGWHEWDVTGAAAAWHDGSSPNHGLVIRGNNQVRDAFFASSDHADAALRPMLVVTYSCECGGAAETIVLQPGAAAAKDTWLYEWKPGWNYGTSNELWVTNRYLDSQATSLLEFDLATLPAQAVVVSATLALYQNSPAALGGTVGVRRVTAAWGEGSSAGATGSGATWQARDTGVAWSTAGGDYAADPHGSASGPAGVKQWYQWDVTTLLAAWQGGAPNLGLALVPTAASTDVFFASSDATDASLHPKLTVDWTCPCGADCSVLPVQTYRDEFDTAVCDAAVDYAGSAGTIDWSGTPWSKEGESSDPCTGNSRIMDDQGPYSLRFSGSGQGLRRPADLSAFSAATLSFDYRREELNDLYKYLSVQASSNGGASWVEVGRIDGIGTDTDYQAATFDLAAYTTAGFVLRFMGEGLGFSNGSGRYVYVDNVQIEASAGGGAGGPAPLTLAAVADTHVTEKFPGSNFGTDVTMLTGRENGDKLARSLLRFDVSAIPAGATVTAATLRLYKSATSGNQDKPVAVHRVAAGWNETTITWNSSGGGVFDATPLETHTVAFASGWEEWPVPVTLVHEWIDGISVNHGFIVVYSDTKKGQELHFETRESATPERHPQLVIEYTPP